MWGAQLLLAGVLWALQEALPQPICIRQALTNTQGRDLTGHTEHIFALGPSAASELTLCLLQHKPWLLRLKHIWCCPASHYMFHSGVITTMWFSGLGAYTSYPKP